MIHSPSLFEFDIAVIGGGLIGKAAALALTQMGLSVALIAQAADSPLIAETETEAEAETSDAFDVRIYALSASTQTLLERLRIWQALNKSRLSPVYDMRIYDRDSNAELHFSAFEATVPQLAWIVESSLLEHALDTALRFQPQFTWFNARAQHLTFKDKDNDKDNDKTDNAINAISLALDNQQILTAKLLVGADGAHSWVRAQTGAKLNRHDYQQYGIIANFRIEKPHSETAYQWFCQREIIALLPLPGPYVSLVWSADKDHAKSLLALDAAQFAATVEKIVDQRFGAMERITAAQSFPLSLQTVDRLIAPRVALIGDAAHLIHPLAGQGINLGLRDVTALTEVIAAREPFRDLGDLTLLRRYERSRREDIQKLVLMTDGLQRLFSLSGRLAGRMRKMGVSFLNAQPRIKRWLVKQAGIGGNG